MRPTTLAGWLAPKRPGRQGLVESLLMTAAGIAVNAWFRPADPLSLHGSFPWLLIPVVVSGLRYGSFASLASLASLALLSLGAALPATHSGAASAGTLLPVLIGYLVIALLCGEFADTWMTRLRRRAETNAYLSERLETLTREYALLRLSHDRLEQDLLTRPMTLRESLARVRQCVLEAVANGEEGELPGAEMILQLLIQTFRIERTGLFSVHGTVPAPRAAAGTEGMGTLDADDPLVRFALERKALSHVQVSALRDTKSRYLAVAPLIDCRQEMRALLVVERMPFLALQEESLQFMAVLMGYYADVIAMAAGIQEPWTAAAECPPPVAAELRRLHRIFAESGLESSLIVMTFPATPQGRDLYQESLKRVRDQDMVWSLDSGPRQRLAILMPLAGGAAAVRYRQRMEQWLKERFGFDGIDGAGIDFATAALDADPPDLVLARLLSRTGKVYV
jgi:hypothetical protein